MASSIKPEPLLTDRTIRYGRAVTIWGSISLVFLYLPGIDLNSFSPFGIKFTAGNQDWVWLCVLIVIIYNIIFFTQGFFTDRLYYRERNLRLEYAEMQDHMERRQAESLGMIDDYRDDNDAYYLDNFVKFKNDLLKAYKLRLWIELPVPFLIGASSIVGISIRAFSIFGSGSL